MLVEPNRNLHVTRDEALAPAVVDRLLRGGLPGRTIAVTPDPRRRELDAASVLARLRAASGHGGGGPRMDYSFDLGSRVRAIVLDLVGRVAGSGGQAAPGQAAWLARELRRAGSRWVVLFSHQPLSASAGGSVLERVLASDRWVLATIAGHTHRNRIAARRTRSGGYWQITTASLADFPQQARMLRISATTGGGAVLDTEMLDTAPGRLADEARALAFLDAQGGRPAGAAGRRLDRNVSLYRATPR